VRARAYPRASKNSPHGIDLHGTSSGAALAATTLWLLQIEAARGTQANSRTHRPIKQKMRFRDPIDRQNKDCVSRFKGVKGFN
jgi:hypothetical protein